MIARFAPYLWYPLFAAGAVGAFALMLAAGVPLPLASYLPVIAVGVAIVGLEWLFPEHLAWRPRSEDLRADAAFMALIQVGLPRLLALLAALAIAAWMHAHEKSSLWPHDWPLAAQAVL